MITRAVPLLLCGLLAAIPARAEDLTVSVAVSVKEAVDEIGRGFVAARPGVTLRYNTGASGALQKQIEAGAPVDVFVSAGARQMDELERPGLIAAETRRAFARNVLVAVTSTRSAVFDPRMPVDVRVLLERRVRRVGTGNPKTVPAGQYTEAALRAAGVWDRVRVKLVFGENVRQVVDYVSRDEVDVGFVYATDLALRRDRLRELFRPPVDSYPPIVYPAAVVRASRVPGLARAFVDRLAGPDGAAVLAKHGFVRP
ncbi:MAG: molybdate ABC transporter substrate-binding protein [Candidatus Rokubacteria bacterium]|nr:molybdate ABC transporter substrate-binding protein [Candidatus Rokubacteria bacterium]